MINYILTYIRTNKLDVSCSYFLSYSNFSSLLPARTWRIRRAAIGAGLRIPTFAEFFFFLRVRREPIGRLKTVRVRVLPFFVFDMKVNVMEFTKYDTMLCLGFKTRTLILSDNNCNYMVTLTDYFLVELRQQLVYQAQTFLLPCAFASKRVFVKNLSHENETVQENTFAHAWFCTRTHLAESKGNSGMAY